MLLTAVKGNTMAGMRNGMGKGKKKVMGKKKAAKKPAFLKKIKKKK